MTFANPLIAAGVAGLCDLYADRAVTPVEACEAYLSRISGLDGALGAYVFVDAQGARAAAHASSGRWRTGAARSRLDGVPVAIKANVAVEGWPWHAGIGALRERLAPADAALTSRLRAAGAVILGLTNMDEGAFGASGENPAFGRTHNPWDYARSPGGSSAGAGAATAAGLCAGAIGTDTLGSIRLPAAFCGVTGHKPAPGLVPTGGVVPMSWTLDSAGPLARSPRDAARLYAAICDAEPAVASEIAEPADLDSLASTPLAVLETDTPLDPDVRAGLDAAVEAAAAAGLQVERVRLADVAPADAFRLAVFVCAAESAAEHAGLAVAGALSAGYSKRLARLGAGSAADLARAYRDLAAMGEAMAETLSAFGAVLLPTSPLSPFAAGADAPPAAAVLTALANVGGLAATAFPIGLDGGGLPRSVQALAWTDETSLGLAAVLAIDPGAPPAYRG